MASDFHTHSPHSAAPSLVSVKLGELGRHSLESLEFHPWNLPPDLTLPEGFEAALEQAAALGEVGLDRLKGPPLEHQWHWLELLLPLARKCRKPVVFHCVRGAAELLAAVKPYPELPKLLHGFRSSPELLEEFRKHGFIVSLSPAALNNEALLSHLRQTGLAGIGFETDDRPEPIEDVYAAFAARLNCNLDIADETFQRFIAGPKE